MTARVEPDRDIGLQGHYAGIVTRAAAFGIDVVIASSLFTLGGGVVEYLFTSVLGKDVSLETLASRRHCCIDTLAARLLRLPHRRWWQNPRNGAGRPGGRHQRRSRPQHRGVPCCEHSAFLSAWPSWALAF